jgi:hypothetical protein
MSMIESCHFACPDSAASPDKPVPLGCQRTGKIQPGDENRVTGLNYSDPLLIAYPGIRRACPAHNARPVEPPTANPGSVNVNETVDYRWEYESNGSHKVGKGLPSIRACPGNEASRRPRAGPPSEFVQVMRHFVDEGWPSMMEGEPGSARC